MVITSIIFKKVKYRECDMISYCKSQMNCRKKKKCFVSKMTKTSNTEILKNDLILVETLRNYSDSQPMPFHFLDKKLFVLEK